MIYEPATNETLTNLQENLFKAADFSGHMQTYVGDLDARDTAYMIVFGGKNAEIDLLFNDIYFLAIP